jgi:hypothetical protein
MRQLRNRWEAANNTWNQWVLGYNPQRQREVLSRLGLADPDWRSMSASLAMLCGLALLVVTAVDAAGRRRADPVRAWQAYCAQLGRRGVRRAEWEGPLDFAQRVAARKTRACRAHPRSRRLLCRAALRRGGDGDSDGELRRLQQCVQRLPPRKEKKSFEKNIASPCWFGLLGSLLPLPGYSQQGAGFSQDPEVRPSSSTCTNSTASTLPT